MFPFLRRSAGIGRLASLWIHARLSRWRSGTINPSNQSICVRCVSRDLNKRRTRWSFADWRIICDICSEGKNTSTHHVHQSSCSNHRSVGHKWICVTLDTQPSVQTCHTSPNFLLSSVAIISLNLFIIRQIVHHQPPLEGVVVS